MPYTLKTNCNCVYNVCNICVRSHYLQCQKKENFNDRYPSCIICNVKSVENSYSDTIFKNKKLYVQINNLFNEISKYYFDKYKITLYFFKCSKCEKNLKII